MIDKIKKRLADKKLKDIENNRKVELKNFNDIKSIGIIYEADNQNKEDLRQIKLYIENLKSNSKNVASLAFINSKKTPEELESKTQLSTVNLSDKDKLGIPNSELINDFTSKSFDLLINAYLKDNQFLDLLNKKSQSKLKVGAEQLSHSNSFDFQIILNGENNLRYLLDQIEFYLTRINTK